MIDAVLRRRAAPVLDFIGGRLSRAGVRADWVTGAGWAVGAGACAAAGARAWPTALALWLANRALDGLDGAVARAGGRATERGAFLDIVADFSVYGGFLFAVAVAEPRARLACLALLLAYYASGSAFLALSSLLEKCGPVAGRTPSMRATSVVPKVDGRSLRFAGGLAEGTETIVVYVLFCLFPERAATIAWVFCAAVVLTALQRVWVGSSLLTPPGAAGVGTARRRPWKRWDANAAACPAKPVAAVQHGGAGAVRVP